MQLVLLFLAIVGSIYAYHHEGDYWMKFDRSELVFYNKSYISRMVHKVTFYNRTQKLLNYELTFTHDLSEDMKANIQVYKFLSNEYRFFPITLSVNVCAEWRKNSFGIKDMLDKYSNIRSCPLKKGSYYLRSAVQDFSAYPPFIPGGMYKFQEKYTIGPNLMWEVNAYYTVTEFLKNWEN